LCEQLFAVPKSVVSRIGWKSAGGDVLKFRAKVLTADGLVLDLIGYWNIKNGERRWGFSLSYFGNCVRSYDMSEVHRNPGGGGKVRGPHKHKFSSSKIPRFAYKPNPPISEGDPNSALLDFLAEANITLNYPYQSFMFP
jgi:hypothetical protein